MRLVQRSLFSAVDQEIADDKTYSTFIDNMKLPVHRWFRYSAGFSAEWVENLVHEVAANKRIRVFDPFAGSGTTVLAAEDAGAEGMGIEAHPFICRIARAKLLRRTSTDKYVELAKAIRKAASRHVQTPPKYPELIEKCYSQDALAKLHALRVVLEKLGSDSAESELIWLTLASILRISSHVGTAQWQYVLPKKDKKRSLDPFQAFDLHSNRIAHDMRICRETATESVARIVSGDARTCDGIPDAFADLVVTSPPYPNNYDYADATRLEMCFFGEISGWGDLQEVVRTHLVRSCTQHVPPSAIDLATQLRRAELDPIRTEISDVCERLAEIRMTKGGKKTYHLMVACYFSDLSLVWRSLRRVCKSGGRVCFVIGDSAPYGIYVPVAEWLGQLALAAGFQDYRFEKTRDRNIKWKNRKHRVPLCEGRLWVSG